ncbi:Protein of unknown function DUF432 [Staphylothermus marinus F1]|uniref:DUF432 domain-containing protein n=1 Tax=Staphylothermus marinus (strain ATCC 43588 / DSM 3639 / JCM 9404 / F1) TaxID=399550 RepID=A3DN41_STAMF|nr:DUF432 domain-containing protein [Staphylothermus marinus]ABN70051.1 Protein of unknown function DUF432 [Staphylothermus marinus F1]
MVSAEVLNGYGVLGIDKEYIVGKYLLSLEKIRDEIIVYRRSINNNVLVEQKIIGFDKVLITPFYPVLLPRKITSFVLVDFSEKIRLAPNSYTEIYIYIPVDIAVYVYRDTNFDIIDVIEGADPKYALYGSTSMGVIARYSVSKTYVSEPEPVFGKAVSLLKIHNTLDEWVLFTQILLDSNNLSIYYREKSWKAYTQEINVTINSKTTASIKYGRSFRKGLRRIDDPKDFKPPRISPGTEMLWGI